MNLIHTPWFLSTMFGAVGLSILGMVLTLRQNKSPSAQKPQRASRYVHQDESSIHFFHRFWQCEQCGQPAADPGDLFCGRCGGSLILLPRVHLSSPPRWDTHTRLVSGGKRSKKRAFPQALREDPDSILQHQNERR